MKNLFFSFLILAAFAPLMLTAQNGLPTNPDPNKCYVRCVTPDVYVTEEVRVETRPAYKKLTVVPAQYETKTERVMVREGYSRYEIVAAEFSNETVTYESEQPYNKVAIKAASFSDASEKIETAPVISRWEYSPYEGCKSEDPGDCQVLCWREYPAQFTSVPTKKLAADASYTAAKAGGKSDVYTKRAVSRAAEVREIKVEPEYATITKRVLVKDESVTEEMVPAEFTTVTREVLKTKGGLETWEEIECELLNYNVLPINYEYNSARLTDDARSIIDEKLVTLMKSNQNVRIEISSHTDSRGSADANQLLSERRAQSVVNYLKSRGINGSRLVAVGYGESRLKNRCADGVSCTEMEHAVNRRTEFRILN
ncbi:MAG: OmpA family protein [Saprospiraceae bacterium]